MGQLAIYCRLAKSVSRPRPPSVGAPILDIATLASMSAQAAALVQHENFATTKFAQLEARVDRIEKQLELRDPQLPDEP